MIKFFKGSLEEIEEQTFAVQDAQSTSLAFVNNEYILTVVLKDVVSQSTTSVLRHDVLFKDLYSSGEISTRLYNVLRAVGARSVNEAAGVTIRQLKKTKDCGPATIREFEKLLEIYGMEAQY